MADDLWGSTTARGVYNGDLTGYNFEPGTGGDKIQREAAKAELAKALAAGYGTKDSTGKSLAAPSQATGLMGVGASKPDTGYAEKAGAFAGDLIGGMAPQPQQATGPMDDSGMYSTGIAPGLFDPARVSSMEPMYSTAVPQTVQDVFGPMQMEQTAQAVQEAAPPFEGAPINVASYNVADVGAGGGAAYDGGGSGGGLVAALDTNSYAVDPLTGGTYNPNYDYQVDPLTGGTYDGGGYQGGYTGGQAQQGSFDPWGGAYGSGA